MMGILMICTHVEITSAGSALYAREERRGGVRSHADEITKED